MTADVNEKAIQPIKRRLSLRRRFAFAAILYVAFLLVIIAIEVVTRFVLPPVNSLDLFVSTPQQKAQVANEKQSGIFEGDPLLLWRLKPNLSNAVWDFTVLSTNAEHFRASRPIVAKEPSVFRILCIGDSVTFGYRVPVVWPNKPDEYDRNWLPYPMLLENELRSANPGKRIEAIVMAVPGYTSHQGLAWLRRDVDWLQPDLVTISFGWNDASYSDVADRVAIRTDWYVVATRWLIDHSQAFAHATQWLRKRNEQPRSQGVSPQPRVSEAEYLNNMAEMTKVANQHGATVVVIGAPYRDAVTNPPEAKLMTQYREALRNWSQQVQVPYVEVLELTEAAHPANAGWFGELIHPNHMGHRLIAAELLTQFRTRGLLKEMTIPTLTP